MNTIQTTLTTEAIFSDDNVKRYLLKKSWDEKKPTLAIIMLAPSEASGIELDNTTMLVLNNVSRLGYGSVAILNLFATLNDFALKEAEAEDADNLKVILQAAESATTLVYAAGVGKVKNKVFQLRQKQVLSALLPFESKLHCLTNQTGNSRLQHPLSPAVRVWNLSPLKISEVVIDDVEAKESAVEKPVSKRTKSEKSGNKKAG